MRRLAARLTLLAPLQHGPYRQLFLSQAVSNVGDWLDILALMALLLYRWDLGAGAWGALLTVMYLPYALFGPFAGVWVDRWQPLRVMLVCDLARAGLALSLVWAPNLASVLLLVGASSVFSCFALPAQQATLRRVVPAETLLAASALSHLTENGARLLGPALGGVAVVIGGARFAFMLDAASFVVSALLLLRLMRSLQSGLAAAPAAAAPDRPRPAWHADMRAGLAHIGRSQALLLAVGSLVAIAWLTRGTDTLGIVVLKSLGVSEGLQGFSNTAMGVGFVVGAALVGQWGQRVSALLVMGYGMLLVGGILALIGTAAAADAEGTLVLVLTAFVGRTLLGVGFASITVTYAYLLQAATPPQMIGRVTSASRALSNGLPLLAPLVATSLANALGLGITYAGLGLLVVGVGVLVVVLQRRVGTVTPEPEPGPASAAG